MKTAYLIFLLVCCCLYTEYWLRAVQNGACSRRDALRVEMSQSAKPITAHDAKMWRLRLVNSTELKSGWRRPGQHTYILLYTLCVPIPHVMRKTFPGVLFSFRFNVMWQNTQEHSWIVATGHPFILCRQLIVYSLLLYYTYKSVLFPSSNYSLFTNFKQN